MTTKDNLTKQAFIKYLEEHPEERFYQALCNFTGKRIYITDSPITLLDPYYVEMDQVGGIKWKKK